MYEIQQFRRQYIIKLAIEIAICDMDYNISVFDVDNLFKKKEEKISPGVCNNRVKLVKTWKFDFSPNNQEIAAGCYSIFVYNLETAEKLLEIQNENKFFYSICYV